jgi:hypothetical protein
MITTKTLALIALFIYLLFVTRIAIFCLPILFKLYLYNKNQYMTRNGIMLICDKPIPLFPIIKRTLFAIFLWPIDLFKIRRIFLKAYFLSNKTAIAALIHYFVTNSFRSFYKKNGVTSK